MRRTSTLTHEGLAAALLLVAGTACQEQTPTALGDSALPDEPLTVEVELDWSEFASNLQVLGGYGSPARVSSPLVARAYEGTLNASTLIRFGAFPTSAQVVDDSGNAVTVTDFDYVGGVLTLAFDTLFVVAPGAVTLEVGALQEEWDAETASWAFAVDTVNDQRAWSEPGAGPTTLLATGVWDPAVSDSVSFALDSADVAGWADVDDMSRGARIEATTDGVRLRITDADLLILMRASAAPDTLADDSVSVAEGTFVYDPPPPAPAGLRIGGVPAWRTTMVVAKPALTGPPELCAAVGCPFTPDAGQISYAGLTLTTQASDVAFQPTDSMRVDVRPVLDPPRLPKSPLGSSQSGGVGTAVAPEAFAAGAGASIEIPITAFMRTLLDGPAADGRQPPDVLALLEAPEPRSHAYASFEGPGGAGGPKLTLILTVGDPQVLP